jgi:hypothetical protein
MAGEIISERRAEVPLAGHIKRVLDERSTHRAPASRFRDELEDYMSEASADTTLRAIISWARYGGPTKRTVGCLALRNRPDSEPATPPAARSEIQVRWSRLSEQFFRVDKWSLCRG